MLRCLSYILLGLVISGCTNSRHIATLQQLPLPNIGTGECCWQLLQSISINNDGNTADLQGVLLQQQAQLSLILLDPMGRRLATITNTADTVTLETNAEIDAKIPDRLLIAAVYLTYWPEQSWQHTLHNSPWTLQQTHANSGQINRHLSYNNRVIISVDNAQLHGPKVNQVSALHHHLLPLSASITTHQRQNLPDLKP